MADDDEGKMTREAFEAGELNRDSRLGSCLLWFFWGVSLSFVTVLSLVLLVLFLGSITLNLYFGWIMSGLDVSVSRPGSNAVDEAQVAIATDALGALPTNAPRPTATLTASPAPVGALVEAQLATVAAIATEVVAARAESRSASPAVLIATLTPSADGASAATAIGAPGAGANSSTGGQDEDSTSRSSALSGTDAEAFAPPASSSNRYNLIPINGQRDSRPAAEHGDLNLKLRDPQPIEVELGLVDAGVGVDALAINLSDIFEPNFVAAYTIHDWDWGCNCKGNLIREDGVVLVGIKTTPGEPVFIPRHPRDIYEGKYYAVLLFADEDSVTFVYAREGTVAMGYSVHYLGLYTDPNLLTLYNESKGNMLLGLTLDTPIGVAGDQLIVAIRDNGKFLDARSINDWWD